MDPYQLQEIASKVELRLGNPAVCFAEICSYVELTALDVSPNNYNEDDYMAQMIDQTLLLLATDNKFPEISSISSNGVTTSFATNDPERLLRRVKARRKTGWMA